MHPHEGKELFMMLLEDLDRSQGMKLNMRIFTEFFFPVVTFIKPWKGLTMKVVESHRVSHCTQEWTKCSKTYLWKEIYMASVIKNRMNSPLEVLFLPLGSLRAVIKYLSPTVSIFRSQFDVMFIISILFSFLKK